MVIASLRIHWVAPDRDTAAKRGDSTSRQWAKNLWSCTTFDAAARARLLSLTADFKSHEMSYTVAPDTAADRPSLELKQQFFPEVPVRGDLSGYKCFYNCGKAERILGWKHEDLTG